MTQTTLQEEIDEVTAFLEDQKTLRGPPPAWTRSNFGSEYRAVWPIEESTGLIRAKLHANFRSGQHQNPSLSIIFRQSAVWRVDLAPENECHSNPPNGHYYGLEAQVCGAHYHAWDDNIPYVRSAGRLGELPARREIQPQIKRVSQALPWLASKINLKLTAEQRLFDVPSGRDLIDLMR